MNSGNQHCKIPDFSKLECRINPRPGDKHFRAEWGLTEHAQLHFYHLKVWKLAYKIQLYFLHTKKRLEEKRASCAYRKPFVIKVKYSSPLSYRFFFSVNIKVAGCEI